MNQKQKLDRIFQIRQILGTPASNVFDRILSSMKEEGTNSAVVVIGNKLITWGPNSSGVRSSSPSTHTVYKEDLKQAAYALACAKQKEHDNLRDEMNQLLTSLGLDPESY